MPDELQKIAEDQYGTGFVFKDLVPTDRMFAASAAEPVNWYKNFNVQDELKKKLGSSFTIPVNNQYQTFSCVGQAWAKYAGIKKVMSDPNPNWVEFSPRDVYSHIYLPEGGSYVLNGGLFVRKGTIPFEQLPSYWSGKPEMIPTEDLMRDKGLEGGMESGGNVYPDVYKVFRQLVNGGSIENVNYDIDSIATAIRDNNGCVIAVYGENNGTWLSKFPRTGKIQWGHALLATGYMYINGKKYILVLNSWGNNIGEGGWQWLGEEWFNNTYIGAAFTWNPVVGNITRLEDYLKIYDFLVKEKYFEQPVGADPYDTKENWAIISSCTNTSVSSQDFNAYCRLKELI